ncbi:hypothetical protein EB796_023499 [Bugula neritina]|uniref:C2H2-type domain-containing protein n=1 Tax=Bugula neritina TaxID=10212 RepID=A0A7J7IXF4_BUGNE|nr:hypothetical protein EB796_023499 [Bugula neritina]
MQRETEVQFLAEPGSNTLESNNHINVYKPNDEYISVSLTVGNLTFEANDLCLFVSQVVPKDPLLVANILKQSEAGQIQSLSNSISQSESHSASKSQSSEVLNVLQTGGNDCGNEFCGHDESQNENQIKSNTNCSCKTSTTPTVPSVPIAENQDSQASHKKDAFTQTDSVNPKKFSQLDDLNQQLDLVLQKNSSAMTLDISSANILTRKPEDLDCSNIQTYCNTGLEGRVGSFQSECQAQDNELITPSGRRIRKPARFRSGASSADLEQTFPGTEQMGKSSTSQISSRDNPPTVADVHVVLEKRKRGRPRKPQTEHFPEEEECDKKPHAGRGKKRPNYKREANIECRLCHHMYKDELSLIAHLQKLHPQGS